MAKTFMQRLFGTKQEKDLKHLAPMVDIVNSREQWASSFNDADFPKQTQLLKQKVAGGASLEEMLPDAFALAREAAKRVLKERAYDEQIMGAIVLHEGKILEMKTGEGKTLTCVPAAYLNALEGKGVHIVTVNDYLAERDAQWMGPVFEMLGLSVGTILSNLDNEARRIAYSCDITYGTNNEFGFDYLRDNMKWDAREKIQPLHHYCIIDEIDSILIDEARTPLIISGQAADDTHKIRAANSIVPLLTECEKDPQTDEYPEDPSGDYQVDEKSKRVTFTNEGLLHIEELLVRKQIIKGSLYDGENFEFVHYMTQAVKAHRLFHLDVDYVIAEKKVQIVDEFTGRILHGRRYSEGLHQAIEAKENIKVEVQNRTLATITFQNFFRMYDKISGMTGTADTEAPEFLKIYNLDVVVIPTHLPLVRKDAQDVIYLNEAYKFDAICDEIARVHATGQPILIGTVSIEKSEYLSALLLRRKIRHEVLNAKNHAREAMIIAQAGAKGSVTIATNMAGRGTDIKLGGSLELRARSLCSIEAGVEEINQAKEKVYPQWKKDYEEVKQLGGLYILGTERHESRRIDNQLRGRSGRQGDSGVSRFFLSLDDSLMRLFAKDSIKNMLGRIGMGADPIEHSMITRAIEKAQTRVEEQNFEIRKHLLEYDDVLNEQRNYIYGQRDEILMADNLVTRGLESCRTIVKEVSEELLSMKESVERTVLSFKERLLEIFGLDYTVDSDLVARSDSNAITEAIQSVIEQEVWSKVGITGEKPFNDFLRFQYLRQIDMRWQEHLEQLEALREAVYLRSYAQKNPLLEYKLEGFDIFESMIKEIKRYIARMLVKVRIQADDPSMTQRRPIPSRVIESHGGADQFNATAPPQRHMGGQQGPHPVQIVRTTQKVGRNEPCPCGSGKKYKHCHGA
ncbi:MAG: preprotein translocase subunit SecA [Sphaerochaetaceae bacterium]|jgi:preprotein translocase subunit SecA|nr:preprotein translocase subunit SecA [Sphaerochaetaceae bacterium]